MGDTREPLGFRDTGHRVRTTSGEWTIGTTAVRAPNSLEFMEFYVYLWRPSLVR